MPAKRLASRFHGTTGACDSQEHAHDNNNSKRRSPNSVSNNISFNLTKLPLMFDKESFKNKLEFYIRFMHPVGCRVDRAFGIGTYEKVGQIMWETCISTLWQTRAKACVELTNSDPETYKSFALLLTTGLNQLNQRINELQHSPIPQFMKWGKVQLFIIDQVAEMADEVEELITTNKPTTHG
jgi:hypothetical protein